MSGPYKADDSSAIKFYSLVVIMILVVGGLIYAIYFSGGGRRTQTDSGDSDEGFTYGKRPTKTPSTTPGKTPSMSRDAQNEAALDSIFAGSRKTPGKHKFSHVAAVRSLSSFTWDDSSYYEETIKPLEPMEKGSFDNYYDNNIRPMVEHANFNPAVAAQIDQAEKHPRYLEAIGLYNRGRYKEAVEIFTNLAKDSPNLYLKSASLGYLQEIYRKAGDKEQEKKAQMALIINNSKLYFKAFPGSEKVITLGQPPESKDVIKRLVSENPKMDFKAPKRTRDF